MLSSLKEKRHKRVEKEINNGKKEAIKRESEGIRTRKGDEIIELKNFDAEFWHSCDTKVVDSEREKKIHKENGQE